MLVIPFVKLINTTVFRLSLRFAAFFTLLSLVTLLAVYYRTIIEVETQIERDLTSELGWFQHQLDISGSKELIERVRESSRYGQSLHYYYALLDKNHRLLVGNNFLSTQVKKIEYKKSDVEFFSSWEFNKQEKQDVIVKFARIKLSNGMVMIVGQAQGALTELREHTVNAMIYAIIVTIVLALLLGAYMGRVVLRHIRQIDRGLEDAIKSNFTKHVPLSNRDDEFNALTLKLNMTLDRVKDLLQGMRHVTDNIAHDMRSPLNRMRSRLEVTLLNSRDESEYRSIMEKTIEDCDGLLNTFNSLLSIASAESGVARDTLIDIDLCQIVDEISELYQVVAEEKQLTFKWHVSGSIFVRCSRQLLAQMITNLVDNAIKYTPVGGSVTVKVEKLADCACFRISDTGPGIPAADRQRVLERFQRLDQSRNLPGNGLGLSMVNAFAKLCNAKLEFADNNPGLIVELKFPLI